MAFALKDIHTQGISQQLSQVQNQYGVLPKYAKLHQSGNYRKSKYVDIVQKV